MPVSEPDLSEPCLAIDVAELLGCIDVPSPRAIFEKLETLGYRGQEAARRSVSLFAYRHIRRLQRIHCQNVPRTQLPPKSNLLMIGPTGCGKTFMLELIFGEIFPLPSVVVDVSRMTETGYMGQDVITVLTRLLAEAGRAVGLAQIGVIVLDEIDKIRLENSSARFAGAGTTKDVKGNVQKELLQIIGGGEFFLQASLGRHLKMNTRDIGFVGSGAFSGLDDLSESPRRIPMGFHAARSENNEKVTCDESPDGDNDVELLQSFGFLPELTARFGRVVRLDPLMADDLSRILTDNILPPLKREFDIEGVALDLPPGKLDGFVEEALDRGTGARGLCAAIEAHLDSIAFERFGQPQRWVACLSDSPPPAGKSKRIGRKNHNAKRSRITVGTAAANMMG